MLVSISYDVRVEGEIQALWDCSNVTLQQFVEDNLIRDRGSPGMRRKI